MKIVSILALALGTTLLNAQDPPPSIPVAAINKALQWMQNDDPARRAAAYRSFHLYGKGARDIYQRTLEKAQRLHEKRLGRLIDDDRSNPHGDLENLATELTEERTRISKLIHTDFKKEGSKVRMLINEMEGLQKRNEEIRKLAAIDSERFQKSVTSIALAMAEVKQELLIIEGSELPEEKIDSDESLAEVLNTTFEGETYLKTKSLLTRIRKEVGDLSAANTTNAGETWANSAQKDFTKHLNENRSLLGLGLFFLEERLSAASSGHSADMAAMGFFSHTSPVENKKTPGDRARLAKFQHQWTGENIYVGSGSPVSAYNAWFASDGHRFIMFSKSPNLIGVGPVGRHWTMMTGKK